MHFLHTKQLEACNYHKQDSKRLEPKTQTCGGPLLWYLIVAIFPKTYFLYGKWSRTTTGIMLIFLGSMPTTRDSRKVLIGPWSERKDKRISSLDPNLKQQPQLKNCNMIKTRMQTKNNEIAKQINSKV